MVSLEGLDCKQYRERVEGAVPEISCPDPECHQTRLRGHGWYHRYLGGMRQPLRRLRCPRCRVSHALLPEDLCAYRDVSLEAVEAALAAGRQAPARRPAGRLAAPGYGGCAAGCAAPPVGWPPGCRRCWRPRRGRGGSGRSRWWARRRAG